MYLTLSDQFEANPDKSMSHLVLTYCILHADINQLQSAAIFLHMGLTKWFGKRSTRTKSYTDTGTFSIFGSYLKFYTYTKALPPIK